MIYGSAISHPSICPSLAGTLAWLVWLAVRYRLIVLPARVETLGDELSSAGAVEPTVRSPPARAATAVAVNPCGVIIISICIS